VAKPKGWPGGLPVSNCVLFLALFSLRRTTASPRHRTHLQIIGRGRGRVRFQQEFVYRNLTGYSAPSRGCQLGRAARRFRVIQAICAGGMSNIRCRPVEKPRDAVGAKLSYWAAGMLMVWAAARHSSLGTAAVPRTWKFAPYSV